MFNFNPMKIAVQKYMSELLKDRYGAHHHVIDRVSHYLVTEQDVREFGTMIGEIYQMGYLKASRDVQAKLAEAGFHLDFSHESKKKDENQKDSN